MLEGTAPEDREANCARPSRRRHISVVGELNRAGDFGVDSWRVAVRLEGAPGGSCYVTAPPNSRRPCRNRRTITGHISAPTPVAETTGGPMLEQAPCSRWAHLD
jgi:hypothetical protein